QLRQVARAVVAVGGGVVFLVGVLRHLAETVVTVLLRGVVGCYLFGGVALAVEEIACAATELVGGQVGQTVGIAVDQAGIAQRIAVGCVQSETQPVESGHPYLIVGVGVLRLIARGAQHGRGGIAARAAARRGQAVHLLGRQCLRRVVRLRDGGDAAGEVVGVRGGVVVGIGQRGQVVGTVIAILPFVVGRIGDGGQLTAGVDQRGRAVGRVGDGGQLPRTVVGQRRRLAVHVRV